MRLSKLTIGLFIMDIKTALDAITLSLSGKASSSHTHGDSELTGIEWAKVLSAPDVASMIAALVSVYAPVVHSHDDSQLTGIEWSKVLNTPGTFASGASYATGTLAARPAASGANNGNWYFSTDDVGGRLSRSNGSSWVVQAQGVTEALALGANTVGTSQLLSGNITLVKIEATLADDLDIAFSASHEFKSELLTPTM